jgi:hypothetical protein
MTSIVHVENILRSLENAANVEEYLFALKALFDWTDSGFSSHELAMKEGKTVKATLLPLIRFTESQEVAQIFATIFAYFLEQEDWPELFEVLKGYLASPESHIRQFGLACLTAPMGLSAPYVQKHLSTVLTAYSMMARKTLPLSERIDTLRTSSILYDILSEHRDTKLVNRVKSLAMNIVTLIQDVLGSTEIRKFETFESVLARFSEWSSIPGFFEMQLREIAEVILKFCSQEELDLDLIENALRPFVNLIAMHPKQFSKLMLTPSAADATTKQTKVKFVTRMVDFFLTSATYVSYDNDLAGWNLVCIEEEQKTRACVTEELFDTFCEAFDTQQLVTELMNQLPVYIKDANDWKRRVAGLMTLSTSAEHCAPAMAPLAGVCIAMILPCFEDPHPRVQYAALAAISQICFDWNPTAQLDYGDIFHDKVLATCKNSEHLRLKSAVLDYIAHFFTANDEVEIPDGAYDKALASIIPLIPEILEFSKPSFRLNHPAVLALQEDIANGKVAEVDELNDDEPRLKLAEHALVEMQCNAWILLMTLASKIPADQFKDTFAEMWSQVDAIMSSPLDINSYDQVKMRTVVLDAFASTLSHLGLGDGREAIAKKFASMLSKLPMPSLDSPTPIVDKVGLRAAICMTFSNLASTLGPQLLQCTPDFLRTIISIADMDTQHFFVTLDKEAQVDQEDDGATVVQIGDDGPTVSVSTSRIDQKFQALRAIGHIIELLPEVAIEHFDQLLDLLSRLLSFNFKPEMAGAAGFSLVNLYNAVYRKCEEDEAPESAATFFNKVLSLLTDAIGETENAGTVGDLASCILELIQNVTLDNKQVQLLLAVVNGVSAVANAKSSEANDAEEIQQLGELMEVLEEIKAYTLEHQAL